MTGLTSGVEAAAGCSYTGIQRAILGESSGISGRKKTGHHWPVFFVLRFSEAD
ncbi:hypothetical protein GIW70_10825 [Pseudomonas syringae]|nr:hypothetical protein [Pseudomonas syringae]MCF5068691.1 hypothetical protein [Pseudomonas syringae]